MKKIKNRIVTFVLSICLVGSFGITSYAASSASGEVGSTGVKGSGLLAASNTYVTGTTSATKTSTLYIKITATYKDTSNTKQSTTSAWRTKTGTTLNYTYYPDDVKRVTSASAIHKVSYGNATWTGNTSASN